MRFTNIIMAYLVIGIVMFGGGAVDFEDSGVTTFFVDQSGSDIEPDQEATNKSQNVGGAIKSVIDKLVGPIVIVWNLAVSFISYLNWPVIVLMSADAPPVMTLLLGVPLTAGFYLSLIRLVKTSA